MTTANHDPLPGKLEELVEELDREVRALPVARTLSARGMSPKLAAHTVEGLRHLLHGEREQAAQLLEAVAEELRDRTVTG